MNQKAPLYVAYHHVTDGRGLVTETIFEVESPHFNAARGKLLAHLMDYYYVQTEMVDIAFDEVADRNYLVSQFVLTMTVDAPTVDERSFIAHEHPRGPGVTTWSIIRF